MVRLMDSQTLVGLAVLAVSAWLLTRLSPIVSPLVLSVLLAYWGQYPVRRLKRSGLSRALATGLVFPGMMLVAALVAFILLPLLIEQAGRMLETMPAALAWLAPGADSAAAWFASANVFGGGFARLGALLLIPVASFYLLRDWGSFTTVPQRWVPRNWRLRYQPTWDEARRVLGGFVNAELPVLLILSALYACGLALIGVEFAVLIGVLAGIASLVPYLGAILGLALSLAVLGAEPSVLPVLAVLALFALGPVLTGLYLFPRWVGGQPNLHPLTVMVSVLAGAVLLEWVGALLALPAAALVTATWQRCGRGLAARPADSTASTAPQAPQEPPAAVDESMRQEDA